MRTIIWVGFGQLARATMTELRDQEIEIIGVKRSHQQHSNECSLIQADVSEPDNLKRLPQRPDLILVTLSPDNFSDQAYEKTYLQSVKNLLSYYNHDTRFLLVSSTRVYGQQHGEWVNELSDTKPADRKGQILLETENLFIKELKKDVRYTDANLVLRFSGIYGHHRNRFVKNIKSGISVQQTPPQYTNRIHEKDCAGILGFLITTMLKKKALYPLYLSSDNDPAPKFDVCQWLAQQLQSPAPIISNLSDNQNKRCGNERIRAEGYEFYYPSYQQGYQDVINSIKAR